MPFFPLVLKGFFKVVLRSDYINVVLQQCHHLALNLQQHGSLAVTLGFICKPCKPCKTYMKLLLGVILTVFELNEEVNAALT